MRLSLKSVFFKNMYKPLSALFNAFICCSTRLKHWSLRQKDRQFENMRLLITGGYVFFVGMFIIVLSNKFISPSFEQELVVLFGLFIAGFGILRALLGHFGLALAPILKHFFKK